MTTNDVAAVAVADTASEPTRRSGNPKLGWILLILVALLLVAGAMMEGHDVTADQAAEEMIAEFNAEPYISIPKIGPIDLSVTKPVLYMWMAMALCCGFAIFTARGMRVRPSGRQSFVETMYEFLHDQVAKSTLPQENFSRLMPYLASMFLFIWTINLISFIPLPFGSESWLNEQSGVGIRDLGLYAATSNINVTLTLSIVTLSIVHYLGIKSHGPVGYLKSWAPPGGLGLKVFMWLIHALGELVKVVSLSVRLFANMLTGHMLILVMFTIIFVVGTPLAGFATVPVAIIFFLFEVGLVATLQAYIFAVLSGSYMALAASHDH